MEEGVAWVQGGGVDQHLVGQFSSCVEQRRKWREVFRERFFDQAQGIYVHSEWLQEKAENYMRYVDVCRDGVFWAVKWEVRVDLSSRVPVKSRYQTDQWVQQTGSVRLAVGSSVATCSPSTSSGRRSAARVASPY